MEHNEIMTVRNPLWNRKELYRHSLPFLLLLSLSLGIICGYNHIINYNASLICFVSFAITLLLSITFRKRLLRFKFFTPTCCTLYCCTLLSFGCLCYNYQYQTHSAPIDIAPTEYQLVIRERLESKSAKAKFESELLSATNIDSIGNVAGRRIILFLHCDSASNTLQCGDIINVYGPITPIDTISNPDAFNYGKYLQNKGFAGELRPDSALWKNYGYDNKYRYKAHAQKAKKWIIEQYEKLNCTEEELNIVKAITLGVKSSLTTQQREEFSIAGASHILAVSGLHVGIILFFLQILLFPLHYFGKTRRLYYYLVVASLWCYAYITGLSPSVCRACLMITITWHYRINNRYINTIESLIISAIILLLINPLLLFDVGFQLSYFAVAAILVGIDKLLSITPITQRNGLCKAFFTLLALSICAQIGTAPLVAYYFHRLPTYSIICNFFVTPLAFLVVPCAILYLIVSKITILSHFLGRLLEGLLYLFSHCVTMIAQLPHAYINVWTTKTETILLCTCLILIAIALIFKYKSLIIASSIAIAAVIICHPTSNDSNYSQFIVFHSPYNIFINIIDNRNSNNLMITDAPNQSDYVAKNLWTHHHCGVPHYYATDSTSLTITLPNNQTIAVVNKTKDCYRQQDSLPVNYLIIADKYPYKPELFLQKFKADTIIIPSAIYPKYCEQLINTCIEHHQPYYYVRTEGVFQRDF